MEILETISQLRSWRRAQTGRVGVVPTMGALHAGHMALVEAARADNDAVIATIFVNPTQFAANEDLSNYPRDLAGDCAQLAAYGTDAVFIPTPDLMYPMGFQTMITAADVSQGLEGARRPGHFQGVATVVAKLFNLTQPDRAYFGQKDAQQVVVIRRVVADLDFPVEVVVCPTVRTPDGLALSSRNRYLTAEQAAAALAIPRALVALASAYDVGERQPERLIAAAFAALDGLTVEYAELSDPSALTPITTPTDAPILFSLVVRMGTTRLLDNMLLPRALNDRVGLTATLGATTP
jgi:pantoate--beta-alanine ligase